MLDKIGFSNITALNKQNIVKSSVKNTDSKENHEQKHIYSPLLTSAILAQTKKILSPAKVNGTENIQRVPGYKNNLKTMLTHNKANILAVILRTMNAQDKDEKTAILEIRTHALSYIKGLPGNAAVKNAICQTKTKKEMFDILENYINELKKNSN